MKSKTPLVLMEQLLMILVFALASALCIQAFVLSDQMSRQSTAQDRAVLEAQNAAEMLKHLNGDYEEAARRYAGGWDGERWEIGYDRSWVADVEEAAYVLSAVPMDSGTKGLEKAEIYVCTANGEIVFSLIAAWQEGDDNA